MDDLRKAFQLLFCCGCWDEERRSEKEEPRRLRTERRELEREEEMKRMELRKVEEKRRQTDIIRKLEEERRRRRLAHQRWRRSEREELQRLRQQKKLRERQVERERKMEEERELAHKRELELQMEKEMKVEEEGELAHKRELELQIEKEMKVEEETEMKEEKEKDGEMEPVRQRMEEVQKEPSMKDEEREEQVEMERKKQEDEKERMERIKEVKNMERQRQREKDLPKKLAAQNVAPIRGAGWKNTDRKQEARGCPDQGCRSDPKKAEVITVKPLVVSYQSSTSTFKHLQSSRPTIGPLVIMVKPLVPILDPEEDKYDQFSPNAPSLLPAPSEGTGAEIEASPEQNLRSEEEAPAPEKSCKDAGAKKSPTFPNMTSRVRQWVSKKMRERYQKEIQEVQTIVEQHGDKYCFGSLSDTLQGKFFLVADYYGEMRERLQEKEAQWQAREAHWREKGKK